jgi:hypothetical protein
MKQYKDKYDQQFFERVKRSLRVQDPISVGETVIDKKTGKLDTIEFISRKATISFKLEIMGWRKSWEIQRIK